MDHVILQYLNILWINILRLCNIGILLYKHYSVATSLAVETKFSQSSIISMWLCPKLHYSLLYSKILMFIYKNGSLGHHLHCHDHVLVLATCETLML